MKTTYFNIWTPYVDRFLQDIATDISYSDLTAWIDTSGALLFQVGQAEHFAKHRDEYLLDANTKFLLQTQQIQCGFDKVFDGLTKQFPSLQNEETHKKYESLKDKCFAKKYLPFIAMRAMITGQLVEENEPDKAKNLEWTIKAFELMQAAVQASLESMKDFRSKMQPTISRGNTSPVLHKAPEEKNADTAKSVLSLTGRI